MNIKKITFTLLLCLGLFLSFSVKAQNINQANFSNVRVDELTDEQIIQYVKQVESSGLSADQLEQVALSRGMSPSEVQKLKDRVAKLQAAGKLGKSKKTSHSTSSSFGRQVNGMGNDLQNQDSAAKALASLKSKIFGQELFRNKSISFQPNINIATPKNYVIGAGDQLLIDIYGYSEVNYQLDVSPEGTINVPYTGMIPVSGLTIEAATSRIKSRLSKIYSGLSSGNTKLSIALGNIRSIKVILTGEITQPGTYTLPSLATVFNALYACGGPSENGSFRKVEVIRGGKKIAVLDLYDFLLNGELKNNVNLQDQDVIHITPYQERVQIDGEVKRPGIFEMKAGEHLSDLLRFAGGFTERAYQARIKVIRNTPTERKIEDITPDSFNTFNAQGGDHFVVNEVLDRFKNRVTIGGAIFRPGSYQLTPGLTVKQLVQKAEGLKEDAFLNRAYISRLGADLQPQLLAINIGKIMAGSAPDVSLMREDSLMISSIFDLKEEYKVSIQGAVRLPGTFSYADGMSLQDLIIKAGGFLESATPRRIEISRRVINQDSVSGSTSAKSADVFQINIDKDLNYNASGFKLKPFDIIEVRNAPGYEAQKEVTIEGEVLYPGKYTITRKNERISDLIKRAGGLTQLAYEAGASLKRVSTLKTQVDQEKESQKLMQFKKLQQDVQDTSNIDLNNKTIRNDFVGINLPRILKNPGQKEDLYLENGDIINVPKQLQTIKVSGEVLSPTTIVYSPRKSFKGYINNAGGFSQKSLRRRSYIIYANGTVKSTHKILFFNNYPAVTPGAEIFVSKKEEKRKLSAGEIVGLTSGLASLGAIVLTVIRLL